MDRDLEFRKFDLNLLKALDVLLNEKNVTRAAERLFVTQQAASGALQRLRRHFGDDLLYPVGRRLELTPLASSLVGPVRRALLAAQEALETLPQFDPSIAKTTCRIAMSDYSLLVVLPRFLQRLADEAPHIRCIVEPVAQHTFERLDMGDLDFSLTAGDLRLYGNHRPGGHIHFEAMFDDDFVCVIDPLKIATPGRMSLDLYSTLRHNSVMFGDGVETIVEKAWARSGLEFDVAVTAPSFSALLFMLPGTPLVATAQRRLATMLAPRLGLAIMECPLPIPPLKETLMWHERSEQDPARQYLRHTLAMAVADIEAAPA